MSRITRWFKAQGIIKLSKGQQSGVGGVGDTEKLQSDFGVELEPEKGFFAVTNQVPPKTIRYLTEIADSIDGV